MIFSVESVDIVLGKPDQLSCLQDVIIDCVLPIDSALTHDWELSATNGVLQGDYTFHMTVTDMADGSQVHTTTAGPSQTLSPMKEPRFPLRHGMDGKMALNTTSVSTLP